MQVTVPLHDRLFDIARAGILAPSADNRHVFRIEFAAAAIRLWPTAEFAAGTERHRRVLGMISLGAVVENMCLRARQLGLKAHITWFPVVPSGPLVHIALEAGDAPHDEDLAAAIPTRHTNRRMYSGPELSSIETGQLDAAVESVAGVRLIWLRGDERRRALGLIWRAESERFLREKLHDELFSSIRFDLSWRESAESGLPPGALQVEAPMRPLFRALRHWRLMKLLSWLGVHRLLGLRAGWLPCWQAPALGLLTAPTPFDDKGAVAVGAALQRVWLRATLLGLAVQPMAAASVLQFQSVADEGTSDRLIEALASGWRSIVSGVTPLLVVRMGRATPPAIAAGRRELHSYVIPTQASERTDTEA